MNTTYTQALEAAKSELAELTKKRTELDQRIEGLKCSIAGLESLCNGTPVTGQMVNSSGNVPNEDANLSDSIREIVATSILPISAVAIRNQLVTEGFDPNEYSNFLTVIHNTLKRLERQREIRMIRSPFGIPGNGWVTLSTIENPAGVRSAPGLPPPPRIKE